MDVLLVHNPDAGSANPSGEELVRMLESRGHRVGYCPSDDPRWEAELESGLAGRVVAIAGGDGTVRKVFKSLARMASAAAQFPALLLPLGTANNIARSVGWNGSLSDVLDSISSADLDSFHFHTLVTGGTVDCFFEGAGVGVFAEFIRMANIHPNRIDLIAHGSQGKDRDDCSLAWLAARLDSFRLVVDARDAAIDGKFLMAEAMNLPRIGRGIEMGTPISLEPDVTELVLVPECRRDELVQYFEELGANHCRPFPAIRLSIRGPVILSGELGPVWHVDDEGMEGSTGSLPQLLIRRSETPIRILRPANSSNEPEMLPPHCPGVT
ncbi:diacylglycerol/lipid kinase family protein [Luteolibacter soli]|uniref:Diacylglycerol kinase family protein n=1 Tax=Luteolibacter soli TaxID=3135280 RepID=A0ABU9B3L3_9BACT